MSEQLYNDMMAWNQYEFEMAIAAINDEYDALCQSIIPF
jgi:hypothetical protein